MSKIVLDRMADVMVKNCWYYTARVPGGVAGCKTSSVSCASCAVVSVAPVASAYGCHYLTALTGMGPRRIALSLM